MGEPNKQVVDVESLRESGRRRGSCLDTFLVMSIVFLFVAVTGVAVGGVMVVMELRSELRSKQGPKLASTHSIPEISGLTGDIGETSPVYKMQNFAVLEAITGELNNSTMTWRLVHHGTGTSVGSNFIYNPDQSSVTAKKAGSYFIYLDLKLKCVHKCSAGVFTVEVVREGMAALLKCEVELRADSPSESKKCWTVSTMDAKMKVMAQMSVQMFGKTSVQNWQLTVGSQMGMFLVD